jgi:hypothetical protein
MIYAGIMITAGLEHVNYPYPVDGGFALSGRKSRGGGGPRHAYPISKYTAVHLAGTQIHMMSFNNILKVGGFSFLLSLQPWTNL